MFYSCLTYRLVPKHSIRLSIFEPHRAHHLEQLETELIWPLPSADLLSDPTLSPSFAKGLELVSLHRSPESPRS